jgi:hypothetical protein
METTVAMPQAFEAAAAELFRHPPDVGKFWLEWLRNARTRMIPRPALMILIRHYPSFLRLHHFGGVTGVEADRRLVEFVPTLLLYGDPVDPEAIAAWLASTRGYLPEPIPYPGKPAR